MRSARFAIITFARADLVKTGRNFYLIQYKTESHREEEDDDVCAHWIFAGWCGVEPINCVRWDRPQKSMLVDSQKSSSAAAAARCSNKLTIFTANIKELVNFQRKCVSAICTKESLLATNAARGWFRIARFRIHFISFSVFLRSFILCGIFVCGAVTMRIEQMITGFRFLHWYYVSLHFNKLNCLQRIIQLDDVCVSFCFASLLFSQHVQICATCVRCINDSHTHHRNNNDDFVHIDRIAHSIK